jgi:hypothetical protein
MKTRGNGAGNLTPLNMKQKTETRRWQLDKAPGGGRPRCLGPDVVVFKLKRTLVQRPESDSAMARAVLNESSKIDGDINGRTCQHGSDHPRNHRHELSLWPLTAIWAVSGAHIMVQGNLIRPSYSETEWA